MQLNDNHKWLQLLTSWKRHRILPSIHDIGCHSTVNLLCVYRCLSSCTQGISSSCVLIFSPKENFINGTYQFLSLRFVKLRRQLYRLSSVFLSIFRKNWLICLQFDFITPFIKLTYSSYFLEEYNH